MMIRIKTTGGDTPNTTQWTEHGVRNVMNHAPTPYRQISIGGEIPRHDSVPNTTGNGSHILIFNFKKRNI